MAKQILKISLLIFISIATLQFAHLAFAEEIETENNSNLPIIQAANNQEQDVNCGDNSWTLKGSFCFKFISNSTTRDQAEYNCKKMYNSSTDAEFPNLLSINSFGKEQNVISFLQENFGLNNTSSGIWLSQKLVIKSHWMNHDQSPLDLSSWADQGPSNFDGQRCAQLKLDKENRNRWIDISCTMSLPFICEKPVSSPYFIVLQKNLEIEKELQELRNQTNRCSRSERSSNNLNSESTKVQEKYVVPIFNISTTKLPTEMYAASAAYDGNEYIYIVGGYSHTTKNYLNSIFRFSITTQQMQQVGTMPNLTAYASAVWDGTRIVYFGGYNGGYINRVFEYTPGTKVAVPVAELHTQNSFNTAVSIKSGESLVFGGDYSADGIVFYSHYKSLGGSADQLTNRLPKSMKYLTSIKYIKGNETFVYLFGSGGKPIYKYNVDLGSTSKITAELPVGLYYPCSAFNGQHVYLFGEYYLTKPTRVMRFNPENDEASVQSIMEFPTDLSYCTAVYVEKQNRAYIFGNYGESNRNTIMYLQF